jgi:hypothetical protein
MPYFLSHLNHLPLGLVELAGTQAAVVTVGTQAVAVAVVTVDMEITQVKPVGGLTLAYGEYRQHRR